jgi:hypothetical protein
MEGKNPMTPRFQKTTKGRHEILHKNEPLSRAARTLLLVIDGSRPLAEWVPLIRGLTESDLDGLLMKGFIQPLPRPLEDPPQAPPPAAAVIAAAPTRGRTGQALP